MVSPKGQIRYDQTPSTLEAPQIGMMLYLVVIYWPGHFWVQTIVNSFINI